MPDVGDARRLVERMGESAVFYKVGMELAYGGGLPLVSELAAAGKQVFLDLKLHDIPNTVERATAQAAKLGARFLTDSRLSADDARGGRWAPKDRECRSSRSRC